ncbi:ATP-dependent DNA helicase Q1, partial [Paramuricea clavata]
MAESRNSNELIEEACRKLSEKLNFPFKLKTEQRNALESLLNGNDVLAVLPTGYGKSLIFQLYILVAQIETIKRTALVVCPLRSIIGDQIGEARGFGISVASLADLSEDELKASEFELLFGSAETVLDKRFLDILKDPDASLNRVLSVIVIDESHTVEMWTGQRCRSRIMIRQEEKISAPPVVAFVKHLGSCLPYGRFVSK